MWRLYICLGTAEEDMYNSTMRFKAMLSRVAMRISRSGAAIPWTAHRNSSHRIQYTISATHCESSEGHLSDATRRFSPRFTPFHSGPRPPCRPIMPFRFPPMPFFLAQTPFRSLLTPCCPCPIRSCPCSCRTKTIGVLGFGLGLP